MGLIPEETIEEVLQRAEIVDVVRQYVALKKAGKSFKGLCPFHDDHDPSLKVHPGKQIYKCFACGAGGNAIGFVMEMEGWSFPEAVRKLADQYGVEVPEQDPEAAERARKKRRSRDRYFEITGMAAEFFENNLWSDAGKAARMYLKERGIDAETARDFDLGYAPDGWENLLGYLHNQGVEAKTAEKAGLVRSRSNSPGHYDRFRHRIVFPVVDIWNNVRAFGGRTLSQEDDVPKYLNSPETAFYTKGEHLYGLHVAKQHFGSTDYALLVEGNFDVIALHAAGFRTAVAPMGTALTPDQADLLSRYAQKVIVAFDGDEAGAKATRECIPALQQAGLEGRVIRFDAADDPDTFVRDRGPEALADKIERADALVGWAINQIVAPAQGDDVERKLTALDEVSEILEEVENRVAWDHYVQDISRQLNLKPKLMRRYLKAPPGRRRAAKKKVVQAHQPRELDKVEHGMLIVLLDRPEWIDDFLDEEYDELLRDRQLAEFLRLADSHYQEHGELAEALLLEQIDDPQLRTTVARAFDPEDTGYDSAQAGQWYQDCVHTLQRRWATRMLEEIQSELERLDFVDQRDRFKELTEQQQEIAQFRDSLTKNSLN
jgi:DNA primase